MKVLQQLTDEYGWPKEDDIFNPSGGGAKVLVQLAQKKLGKALERETGVTGMRIGVLSSDPETSEAPLAIVCLFPTSVKDKTLFAVQRLVWNFSRSLLLITIEPHIIRKWTCCEPPLYRDDNEDALDDCDVAQDRQTPELLPPICLDESNGHVLEQQAAEALSWVELLSGTFFQSHPERFKREKRADTMLLSNLKDVRRSLQTMGLPVQYIHDLLARIIFVQFLFDRKDSDGHSALNSNNLCELYDSGILSNVYTNLADILGSYDDTYALFDWLNQHFNGDLFPGKDGIGHNQQAIWDDEKRFVQPKHIQKLAEFVRGDMRMQDKQLCLWRLYAFDVIPLEFISSIYEEFVGKQSGVGIHYSRDYVVDLMLDQVLPWESEQWNLSILDPACGSGIFLVRAYQRLIYRWKCAHPHEDIPPDVLKCMLEQNLMGIDIDEHAVRVTSFSLYLAMCDEIEPRHYWSDTERVRFPPLRNKRIIQSDFFAENIPGFRTTEDASSYDIVIGNPPWQRNSLTEYADTWLENHQWVVANNDIGIPFVVKSAYLTKPDGLICMVQSTNALLANLSGPAVKLRQRIFLDFKKVERVINFAAFRATSVHLFKGVKEPACILTLRNVEPDGEAFWYECPKPLYTGEDANRIVIEEHDVHSIYPQDIEQEPAIWSILMWGGERDRDLIRRLGRHTNLQKLHSQKIVKTQRDRIPENETSLRIKLSWIQNIQRFQATIVQSNLDIGEAVYSGHFMSVHAPQADMRFLETCCACYNSSFATYYLFLTSGRLALARSETKMEELRNLPLPLSSSLALDRIDTLDALDKRVYELFGLHEADVILIEDMMQYTLSDFKGVHPRPGYQKTYRRNVATSQQEPELQRYCEVMLKVLKATYGQDKSIGAVILSETDQQQLPMRMVGIYLNDPTLNDVQVEALESQHLRQHLTTLYNKVQASDNYQRCIRTYDSNHVQGNTVLIVYIVKPDQTRYWTRSMALRDADAIAADLMVWATSSSY